MLYESSSVIVAAIGGAFQLAREESDDGSLNDERVSSDSSPETHPEP